MARYRRGAMRSSESPLWHKIAVMMPHGNLSLPGKAFSAVGAPCVVNWRHHSRTGAVNRGLNSRTWGWTMRRYGPWSAELLRPPQTTAAAAAWPRSAVLLQQVRCHIEAQLDPEHSLGVSDDGVAVLVGAVGADPLREHFELSGRKDGSPSRAFERRFEPMFNPAVEPAVNAPRLDTGYRGRLPEGRSGLEFSKGSQLTRTSHDASASSAAGSM